MTDQQIIEGIVAGGERSKEACRAIYRRAGLWDFTRKHVRGHFGGQDNHAEDAYQNAVFIVFKNIKDEKLTIESLAKYKGLDGYFRGIVRNTWKDTTRNKNYRWTPWDEILGISGDTNDEILPNEKIMALDDLLRRMDALCRDILILKESGQKDEVTAEELGMSGAPAVANRRKRCRDRLKGMIENDPHLLDLFENELNKKRKR